MAGPMRESIDAAIDDALRDKALMKTRHGALIRAAKSLADRIDAADEPSPAMFTAMLNYIRALGLAPSNEAIDRRRRPKPPEGKMDGLKGKFHAIA